jgi:hypothetical protein
VFCPALTRQSDLICRALCELLAHAFVLVTQGCILEYEGVKKQKHYTFGVVDRAGNSLIRVSTVMQGDAQRWMTALQARCGTCCLSVPMRSACNLLPAALHEMCPKFSGAICVGSRLRIPHAQR